MLGRADGYGPSNQPVPHIKTHFM